MFFVPFLGSLVSSAFATAGALSAGAATATTAAVTMLPGGSAIAATTTAVGKVVGAKVAATVTAAGGSGLTAGMSNAIAANTTTAAMNRKVLKVAKDIGC